ncbi:hypothetical protein [Pseudomonas sp. EpS/L25]|uniref:hypothetical protein n=1 Tax=Pseudomonas sp. EpS/L25 TaxID=1749078 RepID=UPI00128EF5E5|nr:hypothetical protein [Pseudomonas sp. EpS/L25]
MQLNLQELFDRAIIRELVPDAESIVIALHQPSWDDKLNRGSKSTFNKPNKSASRLAVLSLETILENFKNQIGGGQTPILGYGIITVEAIKSIGRESESAVEFEVTVDPLPENPAHAEIIPYEQGKKSIKGRVPNGICSKLLKAMDEYSISGQKVS